MILFHISLVVLEVPTTVDNVQIVEALVVAVVAMVLRCLSIKYQILENGKIIFCENKWNIND